MQYIDTKLENERKNTKYIKPKNKNAKNEK